MKLWYVVESDDYYQYGAWLVWAETEADAITKIEEECQGSIHEKLSATEASIPEQGKISWLE